MMELKHRLHTSFLQDAAFSVHTLKVSQSHYKKKNQKTKTNRCLFVYAVMYTHWAVRVFAPLAALYKS